MNNFLIIDKPEAWTSHDVVAKLRRILKERKIGHLGTLDPLATGVLVVAVGRENTKRISQYMKLDKEYEVEMELGKKSNTYDREGKIENTAFDLSKLNKKIIHKAMKSFWGKSMQTPPAFSAKKIQGKKAYELARKGKAVVLTPVEVEMWGSNIEVFSRRLRPCFGGRSAPLRVFVRFTVTVSSGTYVRSLVNDIGEKLGSGALLTALRRTRVGPFKMSEAKTLDEIANLV